MKKSGKDRKAKAAKPSHIARAEVKSMILAESHNIGPTKIEKKGKFMVLTGWQNSMKAWFGHKKKEYVAPPKSKRPGKRALRKAASAV